MLILLTIILALGLRWLVKKLTKSYPDSKHPRWLAKKIQPLLNFAELLIRRIKKFAP